MDHNELYKVTIKREHYQHYGYQPHVPNLQVQSTKC